MEEMITIPNIVYERLVRAAKVDEILVKKIRSSLQDIKEGRIREWKD